MLKNILKLAKDAVSKSLIIFKVCLEKILKFFLRHQILDLRAILLLVSLLYFWPAKKQSDKKD